ncbi:MAG TPA: RsmE family RNA methyltransferase [Bryobacteraceae bacterium]|nr:RsmE family RNA methyltransferase [Bryobacteraceae bacterium]
MARRRFFVDAIRGGTAEILGEEARHLTRVLRGEPGQQFEISDNRAVWLAEIVEAHGERVVFRVLEPVKSPPLSARITLIAAIVKFDRFEWMIEKATEMGVERILPMEAARTEKGLFEASHKRAERWRRIARESSQQARRTSVPEILAPARFAASLARPAAYRYFMDESGAPALLRQLPADRNPNDEVAVMIGPEGGWTDAERQSAAAAHWMAASLGPLILRAETAATAALAIVANAWMAADSLQ